MDKYIPRHWILKIGKGENFNKGIEKRIWPIGIRAPHDIHFHKKVKEGDKLWFVLTGGIIYGVATFLKFNKIKDNTIPWRGRWDFENSIDMQYKNIYIIPENWKNRETKIRGPSPIRKYNKKCLINLPKEYKIIKNCLNPN